MKDYDLKLDNTVLPRTEVSYIDTTQLQDLVVTVWTTSGATLRATNLNAIELIMKVQPSAFEGKRMKWPRFAWAFHNLVGHPVMQILCFFGAYETAFWVHDSTVPRPNPKS